MEIYSYIIEAREQFEDNVSFTFAMCNFIWEIVGEHREFHLVALSPIGIHKMHVHGPQRPCGYLTSLYIMNHKHTHVSVYSFPSNFR